MGSGEHWSTHVLTEFLALVLSYPDVGTAYQGGVERIAEALEAEVCAIVDGDRIVAHVGFPPHAVPVVDLRHIARARPVTADLVGLGHCATETATLEDDSAAVLLVARMDGLPFTRPEASLLRGMARTLSLCVRMLRTITAERSLRETSEVLVDVERAIAQRAPLQQVLDAITAGARRLLRVDVALLRLRDPTDPSRMLLVSSQGLDDAAVAGLRRTDVSDGYDVRAVADDLVATGDDVDADRLGPGADAGLGAVMAAAVREAGSVIGELVVSARASERRYRPAERELLTRFAEHASLALTDAHTVERLTAAMYDSLTSLASRALFLEHLGQALSRADDAGSRVGLLFCDLDGFKAINDNLGHTTGDAVLAIVAERISSAIRSSDVAARLGGDEFAVLVEDVGDAAEVIALAERIIGRLSSPVSVDGCEVRVGMSIGVVLRDAGCESADELLRNADLAMYRSKAAASGRPTVYESWMRDSLVDRVRLDNDLRSAIDADELDVHYQPVVELETGRIVAVEALARWWHPQRGAVPASTFVSMAEDNGLIHRLGDGILRRACEDLLHWRRGLAGHRDLRVSINVSASQLHDERFVERVLGTLSKLGLPARSLIVEITETGLMQDPHAVAERLRVLASAGVGVAIDDFGTGYSSLGYLRQFPADILKINKVFVNDLTGDGGPLAEGIVGLAAALGLDAVAEGVERHAQAARLIEMGCRFAQGYVFSPPLPAPALAKVLAHEVPAGREGAAVAAS